MNYAGFVQRLSAGILDGLIFFFGLAILYLISTLLFGEWLGQPGKNPEQIVIIVFNLIEIPLIFLYFIYIPSRTGQTIGKKMLGIQVVDEKGQIPSLLKFLLRETIGKFISGIFLSLGYLWMLWDDKKQTWHDKIAGTYVIKATLEK